MEKDIKNTLDILIAKYLEDGCTLHEKKQLLELLSSFDNEKSSAGALFSHLNEFREPQEENSSVDFEKIYNDLASEIIRRETKEEEKQKLQKRANVKRLMIQVVSVAAVFCIAFLLGTIFRQKNREIDSEKSLTASFTEIIAPLGARSEIKLNDGTEVMLNAGSSIKYSNVYNSVNRDLILEGEAYFKVAGNYDLPLVVAAGNINIRATGTEFNVKAYSDEGIIETTLIDGEVEITQKGNKDKGSVMVLKPSQKAIYAQQSDRLTIEKIKEIEPQAIEAVKISTDKLLVSSKTDVEQVTAWTKNKLIIRSENLESLCTKLQRKYNVTFVFSDEEIKKHRFSGVLLDETLQQVIDVIKLTAPVDYLIDGKTVVLFSLKEKAKTVQRN
ncbi:MAG: DUF4974 domain-containing protein [Bacteroidales bacterium]|nr:DUF4974 domain-containing protein [Bacteroidales bacterium]